jgi:hypothetical protein
VDVSFEWLGGITPSFVRVCISDACAAEARCVSASLDEVTPMLLFCIQLTIPEDTTD